MHSHTLLSIFGLWRVVWLVFFFVLSFIEYADSDTLNKTISIIIVLFRGHLFMLWYFFHFTSILFHFFLYLSLNVIQSFSHLTILFIKIYTQMLFNCTAERLRSTCYFIIYTGWFLVGVPNWKHVFMWINFFCTAIFWVSMETSSCSLDFLELSRFLTFFFR